MTTLSSKWMARVATGVALAVSAAVFAGSEGEQKKGAQVGQPAPNFTLVDTNGKEHTLSSYQGKIVVLEWFNSECPFVKRQYETYTTMKDTSSKYPDKVVWLAINSGAPGKQGHGKDKQAVESWKLKYPVLNDETGKVGRLYGAKTTPHMFVIDANGVIQYAGAIDDDPKGEKSYGQKVNYVAQALAELAAGKPVSTKETKPYGCSVKYGG